MHSCWLLGLSKNAAGYVVSKYYSDTLFAFSAFSFPQDATILYLCAIVLKNIMGSMCCLNSTVQLIAIPDGKQSNLAHEHQQPQNSEHGNANVRHCPRGRLPFATCHWHATEPERPKEVHKNLDHKN